MPGLAILAALLFSANVAFATGQVPDILKWRGKTYSLHTNPLERYLESHPDLWRDRRPLSTADWRGYVATWGIEDGRLLLTEVNVGRVEEHEDVLGKLFPGRTSVVADWYTGHLLVPTGRLVEAGDFGYSAVFSSYVLFRIEKGVVTAERELDKRAYDRFRREQFALFRKTSAYQSLVAQSGSTLKADQVEQFIFLFSVEQYTSTIFEER